MDEIEPAPNSRDIDEIVPPAEPTPGPWRARENPYVANPHHTYWSIEGGTAEFGDDGHGFCLTGFISPVNAKILAASFDLYEALKLARSIIGHPENAGMDVINAALAKAESV